MMHFLLVTTDDEDKRLRFHFAVATVANSFERRPVEGTNRATINYVVDDAFFEPLLDAARAAGVTVEEIEHTEEAYHLLVGEPGTGWAS